MSKLAHLDRLVKLAMHARVGDARVGGTLAGDVLQVLHTTSAWGSSTPCLGGPVELVCGAISQSDHHL